MILVRVVLVAALTIALSAGVAAPAMAEILSKQQASVTFTADGDPSDPQPVSMSLRTWFDDVSVDLNRNVQFATVASTFLFEGGLVTNVGDIPACTSETVFQDPALCPAGSQVGSGSVVLKGLGLDQTLEARAFNVWPGTGMTVLLTGSLPLIVREVLAFTFAPVANGRYKTALRFGVPKNLQSPAPGVIAALTDFRLDFPVRYAASNDQPVLRDGRRIPYMATNKGCKGFMYLADYTEAFDGEVSGSQVVESPPTCVDRDSDGLPDARDACPDVPATTADGCPADADGDGKVDSGDRCPGITARTASGCPAPEAPVVTVRARQAVGRGTIRLKVTCNQPCRLAIGGRVGGLRLRPVRGDAGPAPRTFAAAVSAADLRKLRKLLRKRRSVKATVTVTATVPEGRRSTTRRITITR